MSLLARIKSGARRLFRTEVREDVGAGFGFTPDPGLSNLNVFRSWVGIYQYIDRLARKRGGAPIDRPVDERMLYIARGLMRYNPYAQGMIAALRNHTLGSNGFQHLPTGPSAKILGPWLERWKEDVNWWQWEREIYERVHIEGECIMRFFPNDDTVELRPIEPEWIIAKDGTPEWTFGFYNEPDDVHDITALHELTDMGQVIDAAEWYHVKSKTSVRAEKRGRSDFLAIAQLLDDSFKTWRNFLQSEAVRQSVAYFAKQAPGVTTQDLDQAIAAESDYRPPESAGRRGGDPIALQYGAGIEYIQDGTELLAVPAAQAQGTMTGVNAGLLAAGRAYHMPLVLMSGDMSANNTLDFGDESPFGATIKDEQRWYGRHVRDILWRVIEFAVDEGQLPSALLYDGTTIEVAAERRQTQRAGENTQRVKTLYDDGVISARERATMEGVDYDEQQQQRKREALALGGGADADSDLRGTVGGLQAITSLQQQFYAGTIPQAAAIASLQTLFGFSKEEAASMLPPVQPVKRQDDGQQQEVMESAGEGLVEKEIQVHRNGKTFTQTRLVSAHVDADEAPISAKQDALDAHAKTLTPDQENAIGEWADDSTGIRAAIGGGAGRKSRRAKDFLTAIEGAPKHEGKMYRGLGGKGTDELMAKIDAAGEGGIWEDAAPASHTRSSDVAAHFAGSRHTDDDEADGAVFIEVHSKTGRMIEHVDGSPAKEVVSMPGTKYRIISIKKSAAVGKHGVHKMHVTMEEV